METRANYALVGAFTIAVLTAAFGFVFWFSGPSKAKRRIPLTIYFSTSVAGLSDGGGVSFNGLRVGDVTELSLNPENPSEVIAHVQVDRLTPIKTDTRARLEYQGLTGVAQVALFGGSPSAEALTAKPGQDAPTIRADVSQFQDLVETAQRVAVQLASVAEKVNKLVDANADNLTDIVKNTDRFMAALGDNSDNIREALRSVGELARALLPAAANLQNLTHNADQVVAAIDPDSVKSIVGNVQQASTRLDGVMVSLESFLGSGKSSAGSMFSEVSDAAKSIKRTSDNLDARLKDISANLTRFTGEGLKQYEALAVDGRRTLGDISRAARRLEKDPSQVIFGGKPALPEYSGP